MLSSRYATGTQQFKKIPKQPEVKQLRPLRYLNLKSIVAKIKDNKKMKLEESNPSNNDNRQLLIEDDTLNEKFKDIDISVFDPDYLDVYCSIKALGLEYQVLSFIGFDLLDVRVKKLIESKGMNKVNRMINDKKNNGRRI